MASYSDDFDRANGEIGAGWVEDVGDIDIVSNKASDQTSGGASRLRYASALDSANHEVQADIDPGVNWGSITARQASSTDTKYAVYYLGGWKSPGFVLQKYVAGSATTLDSENTLGTAAETTVWLEVNGAVQIATLDAGYQLDGTDSDITAGTYAGMSGGWDSGSTWNNWSAADLAAGGLSIPVVQHHLRRH